MTRADDVDTRLTELARNFSLYSHEDMQDPHTLWSQLRSTCPVAHSDQLDGFWMLTRYEHIRGAALDYATFSNKEVMVPRDRLGAGMQERPPITLDPPRHTAFRQLLLPAFSPGQVARLEPALRQTCRNAVAEITSDEVDVASAYAKKIPAELICTMMGVPLDIAPTFRAWAKDANEAEDINVAVEAGVKMMQWVDGVIAEQIAQPREGLVTALINSESEGRRLTRQELAGSIVLIMLGGLDTAWSVISSMLWHLGQHPEDRQRLAADPSLAPTAVEEYLRFFSPLNLARITNTATTVDGVEIGQDESVLLCYASANRDPDVFFDPDRVVIDRAPNRHMAFGVGPHRCIGSNIARLELRVALQEWMAAFPDFELTDPHAVHWTLGQVWGPTSVPTRILRRSTPKR
jgi:cytochrome P450